MPVFPPGDVIRDLSLLMMGGVVFYSTFIAALLYRQWYSNQLRKIVDIRFAWATFFLGMVVNRGSFILSDFIYVADPLYTLFTKLGYVGLILALSAFFFAVELILPFKTRNAFFVVGLIHVLFAIVIPREWLEIVAVSIALVTFVVVSLFLNFTMKNTSGNIKESIKTISLGFLLGYFGFIFASDMSYNNLGPGIYLIGATSLVLGLALFGYGSIFSPALGELDWRQQLVELYIIQKGGLLIYHHEFRRTSEIDQMLTAAGISGIQSLFQEITSSEAGLNVVSVGQFELLFSHSPTFTSVLISRASYKVLLDKLVEFTDLFELMFGRIIQNFEGSLKEFSSAHELVNSIF